NSNINTVFSMVDGSYGFIITETDDIKILNTSIPHLSIYYKFLNPITREISEKSLLYQARNVSISFISCSSNYSEYGNVCMITELTETFGDKSKLYMTYQIDFLSSGSVIEFKTVHNSTNSDIPNFYILPSFYGGSIVTSWVNLVHSRFKLGFAIQGPSINMTGTMIMLNGSKITW
ncbi:4211_t:CDS:1, partial [Scutellospora calospora]